MPGGRDEKQPGLRARVRGHARAEVAQIAFDLFAEKGFEDTTVGEVAEAAGISRSSFFRLFSSKEDAIFTAQETTGSVIAEALDDRPEDESPWTALRESFIASTRLYVGDEARGLARARLVQGNPSLRARRLELHAGWADQIRGALARRMEGIAEPLEIEAVLAAALAAFDAGVTLWSRLEAGGDLVSLVGQAFAAVARFSD